jgi:hypothetical protein
VRISDAEFVDARTAATIFGLGRGV